MKQQQGFTLIESLIAASIMAALLFIAIPLSAQVLDQMEEREFFNMLDMDMLLVQSSAMTTKKEVALKFNENFYTVAGTERSFMKRPLPRAFHVKSGLIDRIGFNNFGSIRKSGRILIGTKKGLYALILPLGKGRARYEKQ